RPRSPWEGRIGASSRRQKNGGHGSISWADKLSGPMTQSEELRRLTAEIAKALDSPTDAAAIAILNPMANSDPAVFFGAAIRVLAAHRPNEGSRHLVVNLAKDKRLAIGLLDS